MGLIGNILGGAGAAGRISEAAGDLVEVFRPNATREMELAHDARSAALAAQSAEFAHAGGTWFDSAMNGLNRLPRPALALGTVGLFAFSMADPARFATRMQGLAEVPDPLWWLLGAIVSFYFGARELHYLRGAQPTRAASSAPQRTAAQTGGGFPDNAALRDWAQSRGK